MKLLVESRKGHLGYIVQETYDTGVFLRGTEVKSLQSGRASLEGAFVVVQGGELWLRKAFVPPYQERNTRRDYDPYRDRKLLLHKHDIKKIADQVNQKGVTVIPMSIWLGDSHQIFVRIAVVRHANKADKREKIKSRDTERELRREFKGKIKL